MAAETELFHRNFHHIIQLNKSYLKKQRKMFLLQVTRFVNSKEIESLGTICHR
jgi:hypothetical protein